MLLTAVPPLQPQTFLWQLYRFVVSLLVCRVPVSPHIFACHFRYLFSIVVIAVVCTNVSRVLMGILVCVLIVQCLCRRRGGFKFSSMSHTVKLSMLYYSFS